MNSVFISLLSPLLLGRHQGPYSPGPFVQCHSVKCMFETSIYPVADIVLFESNHTLRLPPLPPFPPHRSLCTLTYAIPKTFYLSDRSLSLRVGSTSPICYRPYVPPPLDIMCPTAAVLSASLSPPQYVHYIIMYSIAPIYLGK